MSVLDYSVSVGLEQRYSTVKLVRAFIRLHYEKQVVDEKELSTVLEECKV